MSDTTDRLLARAGMSFSVGIGNSITFKAVSGDTGGAYALMEYIAAPGAGAGFHTHLREDEAFYILSGTFEFVVGDQTIVGTSGDYIQIPRGQRHTFRNPASGSATALIIVSLGGLEQYFVDLAVLVEESFNREPDVATANALAQQYQLVFE